ncbi:hypothetical protein [Leptospira haakeii]|uniref:Lipoprotein n=1 Tax=Leptospira haakeii TaxID=2023198 RepID=A0ABX4PNB8_9LEPT|nr:hypothetical protein [Leptospira haakeii]PKA15868.1 hypothetical protein CH363_10135 [Leptospira haakeii]PKA19388.1 hypothetical protein CH377_12310 [Leptospira haakeii]
MKIFEKIYIFVFFILWSCNTEPYIKQIPPIFPGKDVTLKIDLDNSLMPEYKEMVLTKFCLGRTEQDLERNCEMDPIIRYYPIKSNEPLHLIIPEGYYPYGKMIFWSKSPSFGSRSSMAVAYFSRDFEKSLDKKDCSLKGVSLEGSVGILRYNCKGLIFKSKQTHQITFRVVNDSYMDGLIIYTALTPIRLGGNFQAAEIKYYIHSSNSR